MTDDADVYLCNTSIAWNMVSSVEYHPSVDDDEKDMQIIEPWFMNALNKNSLLLLFYPWGARAPIVLPGITSDWVSPVSGSVVEVLPPLPIVLTILHGPDMVSPLDGL